MILITGASGSAGSAVLDEVRKTNTSKIPVKAMYRNANDAKKASGVDTVTADFADKGSLKQALKGVDTAYLVCSPIPALVQLESNFIDAARESGVRHIVQNSALAAGEYPKSFPSWHRKVEDKLKTSGLAYTILRPNGFLQNITTYYAPTIRSQNAFYAAMNAAKVNLADVRDVAGIAAKALLSPDVHAGKTYEFGGPEALSCAEIASRISKAIGRTVQYVNLPEAAVRKSMADAGAPQWLIDAELDLELYYQMEGKSAEVNDTLQKLLGRAPIGIDQFLNENKDSFRSQAAGA
jgi:uncharacterized protein YbjT (DUF2867 family)